MLRGEAETTWVTKRAHELGLLIHPQARVVGAPLIASHVGGDVAAAETQQGIRQHIERATHFRRITTIIFR